MIKKLLTFTFILMTVNGYCADQYKINNYTQKQDIAGPIGLYGANGNVGIGTLAPSCQLDVGVGGSICVAGLPLVSGSNYWSLSAGNVGINTTNNVGIGTNLTTNAGLTVMSGNVGIGTWKPQSALEVNGNINVKSNTISANTLTNPQSQTMWSFSSAFNGGVQWNPAAPDNETSGSAVYMNIKPSYNQTSGTASNTDLLISRTQTAIGSGRQTLIEAQVGGVPKFTVDNNGNIGIGTFDVSVGSLIVATGNIGIGTTTPQTQLAVYPGNVGIGTWTSTDILTLVATSQAEAGMVINSTPSCNSNIKLLLHLNTDRTDSSCSPVTITNASSTIDSTIKLLGAGSSLFNGTSQYFTIPSGTISPGANAFIIAHDLYPTSATNGDFYAGDVNSAGNDYSIYMQYNGGAGGNTLTTSVKFTNATQCDITHQNAYTPSAHNWVALVSDTTTMTLYLNGTASSSTCSVTGKTVKANVGTTWSVGRSGDYTGTFLGGNVDEFIYATVTPTSLYWTSPANEFVTAAALPRIALKASGSQVWTLGADGNDANKFKLGQGGLTTSTAITIDSSGNVGIGTTLPKGRLITMSGNVGIGTINPGATLDVQGTLRLNGTGANSFRVQSAANQVCTTTCTTGKAIVGYDQGTLGAVLGSLVGPSDATADNCLCGS